MSPTLGDYPPEPEAPAAADRGSTGFPQGRTRLSSSELRRSLFLITIAWGVFGTIWSNTVTGAPFAAFARALGATDVVFGVLMGAPVVGVLGQILGAYLIGRLKSRRRAFLWCFTPQRLLWIAVAGLPWVIGAAFPNLRLAVLVVIVFASSLLSHAGSNSWMDWTADIIPPRIRGRYLGTRMRLATAVGVAGAAIAGLLLDWNSSFLMYSAVFAVASLLGTTDILLFHFIPEPPLRTRKWAGVVGTLSAPFRDSHFRRYLCYCASEGLAFGIVVPTFWLFALEYLNLGKFLSNLYLVVLPAVLMAVTVAWWGRIVDRYGCRPVILLNSGLLILLPFVWVFTRPQWHFLLVMHGLMGGIFGGALTIADFNLLYRMPPARQRPAYLAVAFMVAGIAGGLGPIIGGTISQCLSGFARDVGPLHLTGLHVAFLVSAAARCVHAFLIAPCLREAGALSAWRLVSDMIFRPVSRALRG